MTALAITALLIIIGTPNAIDSGYPLGAGTTQIIIATVVLLGLILISNSKEDKQMRYQVEGDDGVTRTCDTTRELQDTINVLTCGDRYEASIVAKWAANAEPGHRRFGDGFIVEVV